MQIRPLFDRVVIQRIDEPTKSKGGLFLPETAKEKPSEGRVIAVGQGKLTESGELRALSVKVGDIVAFGRFAGTEVKVNGEERLVLREDEIFGVIES